MRIWNRGKAESIKGFSIAPSLWASLANRSDLRCPPAPGDLTPEERLHILSYSDLPWTAAQLATLHLDCSCFAEAYQGYSEARHHRKMGDTAWAMGRLDLAESHYRDTSPGQQSYRKVPDGDRLVRLDFIRDDRDAFFRDFQALPIAPDSRDWAWINGREVSTRPYLEMLAVMERRCPGVIEDEFLADLEEYFLLSPDDWLDYRADPRFDDPVFVAELRFSCLPIPCRRPMVSREEALARGATPRALSLAKAILDSDRLVDEAQDALERYAKSGAVEELDLWSDRILCFADRELAFEILFRTLGHGSYRAEPDLMERLRNHRPELRELFPAAKH